MFCVCGESSELLNRCYATSIQSYAARTEFEMSYWNRDYTLAAHFVFQIAAITNFDIFTRCYPNLPKNGIRWKPKKKKKLGG